MNMSAARMNRGIDTYKPNSGMKEYDVLQNEEPRT